MSSNINIIENYKASNYYKNDIDNFCEFKIRLKKKCIFQPDIVRILQKSRNLTLRHWNFDGKFVMPIANASIFIPNASRYILESVSIRYVLAWRKPHHPWWRDETMIRHSSSACSNVVPLSVDKPVARATANIEWSVYAVCPEGFVARQYGGGCALVAPLCQPPLKSILLV